VIHKKKINQTAVTTEVKPAELVTAMVMSWVYMNFHNILSVECTMLLPYSKTNDFCTHTVVRKI